MSEPTSTQLVYEPGPPNYLRIEAYSEALGEIIRREADLLGRQVANEMGAQARSRVV